MAEIDVDQWLEGWVETNITAPRHVDAKAEMRDAAEACAVEATSAGISIAALKEAAGGDLETYLVERQNARADAGTGSAAGDRA